MELKDQQLLDCLYTPSGKAVVARQDLQPLGIQKGTIFEWSPVYRHWRSKNRYGQYVQTRFAWYSTQQLRVIACFIQLETIK